MSQPISPAKLTVFVKIVETREVDITFFIQKAIDLVVSDAFGNALRKALSNDLLYFEGKIVLSQDDFYAFMQDVIGAMEFDYPEVDASFLGLWDEIKKALPSNTDGCYYREVLSTLIHHKDVRKAAEDKWFAVVSADLDAFNNGHKRCPECGSLTSISGERTNGR